MATLTQAAATFGRLAIEMPMAEHDALELGCQMIEAEAKRVIGTYDYGWTALKPETVARKANGDTPLIETGEMRDSIEHQVRDHIGYVGSDNMKAVWQELGTSRGIPPRSFLMGAAMRMERPIVEMTGRLFYARLASGLGLGVSYNHWAGPAGAPLPGGSRITPRSIG